MNTSRLDRALRDSVSAAFGRSAQAANYIGGSTSIYTGSGVFSKFVKVQILKNDGTFEIPLFAFPYFLGKPIEDLYKSLRKEELENRELLIPIHCVNSNNALRYSTMESAIIDNIYSILNFGVRRYDVGRANDMGDTPKNTFYGAPGILLDENFNPILYMTVSGKYKTGNAMRTNRVEGTLDKCTVYFGNKLFLQLDSISKTIVKKILPFFLFNTINFSETFVCAEIMSSRGMAFDSGQSKKAEVVLSPLDNLIHTVQVPSNFEQLEEKAYEALNMDGAVNEILEKYNSYKSLSSQGYF